MNIYLLSVDICIILLPLITFTFALDSSIVSYPNHFPTHFNPIIHNQFKFYRIRDTSIVNKSYVFEYTQSSELAISVPSTYYLIDTLLGLQQSTNYYNNFLVIINNEAVPNRVYMKGVDILINYLCMNHFNKKYDIPFLYASTKDTLKANYLEYYKQIPHSAKENIEFQLNAYYNDTSLFNRCFKYYNTRIYEPLCTPTSTNLHAFLVTGLGGSGSHFISNMFRSLNINVLHETFGRLGTIGWMYAVNNVIMNLAYPQDGRRIKWSASELWETRYQESMLVVRCPMKQISANTAHSNQTFDFILHHALQSLIMINTTKVVPAWLSYLDSRRDILLKTPRICQYNTSCFLSLASLTFVYWNLMVNETASLGVHHIQDIPTIVEKVCGVKPLIAYRGQMRRESKCLLYLNLTLVEKYNILNVASNKTAAIFDYFMQKFLYENRNKPDNLRLLPPKYQHHYYHIHNDEKHIVTKDHRMLFEFEKPIAKLVPDYRFPTIVHKWHKKYSWKDLYEVNPVLALDVKKLSNALHFRSPDNC